MPTESKSPSKRKYRKRRRAELEDETRRRITEAAVELHGSVGPAQTTISAVAERAGVQRATLYRHFPDEATLFAACSSHWAAEHPLPDLADWTAIADPEERLRTALIELYAWYENGQEMLEKTLRDAATVPAMRPTLERTGSWFAQAVATLVRGRPQRGGRRRRVEAALGHAVSFTTWRSLVGDQGLSDTEAIVLMHGLVKLAAEE